MAGKPALKPSLEALRALGPGQHHYTEIATKARLAPATVSNAFNYHLEVCRDKDATPLVTRVQNGWWMINEENTPSPEKTHQYTAPFSKTPPPMSNPENAIFEHFHTTKSGTMLVRGLDGTVYKLEELDF